MEDVGEGRREAKQTENLHSCSQEKNSGSIGSDGLKSTGPPGNFQMGFMEGHLSWGK